MGSAVAKRKSLRSDAISSVAAKVRAARAFGEYLSHAHPENRNGSDHLLSDTFIGQDAESPDISHLHNNNHLHPYPRAASAAKPSQEQLQPGSLPVPAPASSKRRLSVERSLSQQPQQQQARCVEGSGKPARVYTITKEGGMLAGRGSEESLELEVLKGNSEQPRSAASQALETSLTSFENEIPLQAAGILLGGERFIPGTGSDFFFKFLFMKNCAACIPSEQANNWFPKENMFSFQTATTTMQAAFRGNAERKRRKREQEATALMERNFRKHLRMVGSRRMKAQTFADRKAKSFSRSWSDPTPIKPDPIHDSRDKEIEKKLTAYRKGCKIWNMLIFCQGGPGHLYLLKNKVATFAKVEKEEDMIQFWKKLARMMSLLNPEPNLVHIMGCYVLGNANGEKVPITHQPPNLSFIMQSVFTVFTITASFQLSSASEPGMDSSDL
uniref:NMDA receptor synaptonuclear signaling and neuronal migration factor b n=1 Tax=Astyanax mexicanus TaxID=7994 RepID=A0A8B9GYN6_ASTMX